jgi:hypothetical protein
VIIHITETIDTIEEANEGVKVSINLETPEFLTEEPENSGSVMNWRVSYKGASVTTALECEDAQDGDVYNEIMKLVIKLLEGSNDDSENPDS